MHLIYNVYLIGSALGSINCGIAEVADIVHAVVGGGINFHDIGKCAAVGVTADVTFKAGIAVLHVAAVHCFCEDTGAGGLTRASRTREKVCVGSLSADYLIFQGFRGIFLRDDVIKGKGTPFAVECLVHSLSPFTVLCLRFVLQSSASP